MISKPLNRAFHKQSFESPYKHMSNEINNSFEFMIQYIKRLWKRSYQGRETINLYFDCLKCRQLLTTECIYHLF